MKSIFYTFLIFCVHLQSQKRIEGIVKDGNGPIFAVNVFVKANPEVGTVTNFEGVFALEGFTVSDTLVVSYLGYQKKEIPIKTLNTQKRNIILLKPSTQSLDEVILTGPDPISDKFAVRKLEKLDIYLNPIAQGDPLKAITILPASTIDDETVNPSLRGSDPDRSRVVFNNVPVYNPVRASQLNNQGFFSLFNTELIDKQYVYASNPPLTFGNTSAGLVTIQTVPSLTKDQLKLSSSLASTGFFASKRLKGDENFIQLYGNYQFSEAFLGIQEAQLPELNEFDTFDIGMNAHLQLGKKLSFNSFSYFIDEDFSGTSRQFTFSGDFNSAKTRGFTINNLNYASKLGYFNLNFGLNKESQNFDFGNTSSVQKTDQLFLSLNHKTKIGSKIVHQTTVSWDYSGSDFDDEIPQFFYANAPSSPTIISNFDDSNSILELGSYTSWDAASDLLISGGLRTNFPMEGQDPYFSYQLGLRYALDNTNTLLLSGGKYHNYSTPSFFIQDYNLLNSQQLALDYTYSSEKMAISAAVYTKNEKGLQSVNQFLFSDNLKTLGAEFFIEKRLRDWLKLSVAYSYLQQTTTADGRTFPGLRDYDYFLKSSLELCPRKWPVISLNWIGRPGRRFTPIVNGDFDGNTGFYIPNFSPEFLEDRYGTYARLDLSMSKYYSWKNKELVLFASVNNILDRANQRIDRYNTDYTQRNFDTFQLRLIYFGLVFGFTK